MKINLISKIAESLTGLYISGCLLVYFGQEKIIFHPTKIAVDTPYKFDHSFKEINLQTKDGFTINSLYFKAKNPKGIIYYLHGNSGDLTGWGDISRVYLDLNYDVFLIDYRSFGKSTGKIISEQQFYDDAQLGYDYLKEQFTENEIIIVGYSIGTGAASYLASVNSPKLLLLQAPYYNMTKVSQRKMPFIPTFLLKYKFENDLNISNTKCPIYIFHGTDDSIISYEDTKKLKQFLKENDEFVTLENKGHAGINENKIYLEKLNELL